MERGIARQPFPNTPGYLVVAILFTMGMAPFVSSLTEYTSCEITSVNWQYHLSSSMVSTRLADVEDNGVVSDITALQTGDSCGLPRLAEGVRSASAPSISPSFRFSSTYAVAPKQGPPARAVTA